jgi:hypothetical protein
VTRFLTLPVMYVLLALVAVLGVATTVQTVRLSDAKAETADAVAAHATTRADHAEVLRDLADRTAAVAAQVRKREGEYLAASAAADETYRKEKARALSEKDRVIAGLRSGIVQLRDEWQALACAPGDSADPAAAAATDRYAELARLREEGAGAFVQDGIEADSWITWLQVELIATRTVCGVGIR